MTDLPPIEYLDEAARAVQYINWDGACRDASSDARTSIRAHARALHQLAQARAEIAALKPRETLEQVARRLAARKYESSVARHDFVRGFLRGVQMQKEGVLPDE